MFGEEFSSNKTIVPAPLSIPTAPITVFLGPRKQLATCADDGFDKSVGAC